MPLNDPMHWSCTSAITCLPYFEANLLILMPNARPSETMTAGITPDQVSLPLT